MQRPPLEVQIQSKPGFLRSNSTSGSPGLLLCECLTAEERQLNLKGYEEVIGRTLSACSRCTFENCLQYLLVLLGLPGDLCAGSEVATEFETQVIYILHKWVEHNGAKATLGLLTEQLRNHRTISEKIYDALKLEVESRLK